ncbi:MAG TPA: DUF177 domain-containing protein [Vicinamibacterales bacterium]|nr:DUF177 domain-containing protein [Vicinamibacterales bacterium]
MLLSLRSLYNAHEHFEKQYAPSLFPRTDDDLFYVVSPVKLSFDVDGQDTGRYQVAGRLTGDLELMCSRCLEPFGLPVATDFDLWYVPRAEDSGEDEKEDEKEVEEDDLATAFYVGDEIDLGQLIMEQFQLALPMKPLCDVACRGLCPQCGTNLNTGSCGCKQEWIDPRLEVLKKLKT